MTTTLLLQHDWQQQNALGDDGNPYDLIFADPPYDYGVKYDDDPTRDLLGQAAYQDWVAHTAEALVARLRPGGTLWWLCPAEQGWWIWPMLRAQGRLLYHRPIIWHERFSQYQQRSLTADYRLLFPIVKAGGVLTFNPDAIREESERQRMNDKRADPRGRVPGHVWRTRRLQGTAADRVKWHAAQLPPEPLERIVAGWTNPGDSVMDAFAGSGSMGLACRKLNRNCTLVDRSETYLSKIKQRLGED